MERPLTALYLNFLLGVLGGRQVLDSGRGRNYALGRWSALLWQATLTLDALVDDVLANLRRLLQPLDLDVQTLDVCIFRLDLEFDAFDHFFEHLDFCLNVITTL